MAVGSAGQVPGVNGCSCMTIKQKSSVKENMCSAKSLPGQIWIRKKTKDENKDREKVAFCSVNLYKESFSIQSKKNQKKPLEQMMAKIKVYVSTTLT